MPIIIARDYFPDDKVSHTGRDFISIKDSAVPLMSHNDSRKMLYCTDYAPMMGQFIIEN